MGANSFGEQIISLKDRKTAISNLQNIRMLQTRVNNDIYDKYFLIHNNIQSIKRIEPWVKDIWVYKSL